MEQFKGGRMVRTRTNRRLLLEGTNDCGMEMLLSMDADNYDKLRQDRTGYWRQRAVSYE